MGAHGVVHAFDIQEDAINNTKSRLQDVLGYSFVGNVGQCPGGPEIRFWQSCHSNIRNVGSQRSIKLICFNLGYLPGGDHGIITRTETTLKAVKGSVELIASGGMISVMAYVGHPGGQEEYDSVRNYVFSLPADHWNRCELRIPGAPKSPVLILLFRKPNLPEILHY